MTQYVAAHHLNRLACLYIRQSTLQQVFENTESTFRQYALRERVQALCWAEERIVVIDQDLGHLDAVCGLPGCTTMRGDVRDDLPL